MLTRAFTYLPPGDLIAGSGGGRVDFEVYAPDIRFPIEETPAYPNSQVHRPGGCRYPASGDPNAPQKDGCYTDSGSQNDPSNFSYPWQDNYCEKRTRVNLFCPSGTGHHGQDIRPATYKNDYYYAVAAEDGIVEYIGSFSVKIQTTDKKTIYQYLHMNSNSVAALIKVGQTVTKGQRIGLVSTNYNGTPTTLHLHFEIHKKKTDNTGWDIVPPYMSLVKSYQKLLGISESSNTGIKKSYALKLILDKFNISTVNAGFNNFWFQWNIVRPTNIDSSTEYYDYIVTAFNRGIIRVPPDNTFDATANESVADFITRVVRTIPIPLENSTYNNNRYPYDSGKWYYPYINAAYNAGLIDSQYLSFEGDLNINMANDILNRADNYFRGPNSGISIYARWNTQYVDMDLYLYTPYDGNGIEIKHDQNWVIENMDALRNSGGIVYWNLHSSAWGANLDYDSWGGNGRQPWADIGEERVTVDSLMVKRPGKYSIIFCYYDWPSVNPAEGIVEWWGFNRGNNINVGGQNFFRTIKEGECVYSGYLNTW